MILTFPHKIIFLATPDDKADDNSRRAYISRFFEAQLQAINSDGIEKAEVDSFDPVTIDELAAHAESPPFINNQTMLDIDPADPRLQSLMDKERELLQNIASEWYLPSGETLVESAVRVLASDYQGCPRGTVVVVRQTDRATIAFLLIRIRVDAETLVFDFDETPVSFQSQPAPRSRMQFSAASGSGGNPDVEWQDIADTALNTLSTLSFGLPAPWNVLGAATMGLVEAFLPAKVRPNQFKILADNIQSMLDAQDQAKWIANAQGLASYISEQLIVMKQSNDKLTESGIDELLRVLDNNLAPGGDNLYQAIFQASSPAYLTTAHGIPTLVACMSSYLAGRKFHLMLNAMRAVLAQSNNQMHTFNEY